MQTYVNNWLREITLAQGATSCPLDLPDGEYRLTLADTAGTEWEIVDATVVNGVAALVRAREGTANQLWPLGSVIYCAVTAGQLNSLMQRINLLEVSLQLLTARVADLEEGGAIPNGALTDPDGRLLVDAENNYLTTGE